MKNVTVKKQHKNHENSSKFILGCEIMEIKQIENKILIKNLANFSVELCLNCGQAFRWENNNGIWQGVVKEKLLRIEEKEEGILFHTSLNDFNNIWFNYFDLGRDYEEILQKLKKDKNILMATEEFSGIRILNQDPWEALCSFIISQNNNIPRIKGIISRLCENFGKPIEEGLYTFPGAEELCNLSLDDFAPLRAGFRNKYILDAAQKVASGEVDIYKLKDMPIEQACEELLKIKGVGAKVAQCTLLYGCEHIDAFPVDVWVKRVMSELYENGLPECTKGFEGIAQQYLFHWRRNSKNF